MKVLVDTNVALDVFLVRQPFYKDSFSVFQLADGGYISGVLTAVSTTNIFYLLCKARKPLADIYQNMDDVTSLFTVAPITETMVATALALRWHDFEDAVQYTAAKESKVDFIITRNKADFEVADIPCMTPTEFIAYLRTKEEAEINE